MTSTLMLPTQPDLLAERNKPFIHRDLSWLQFNDRVLAEAMESSNPLLDRLQFLSIFSSNLDEFFMIRFASIEKSISKSALQGDQKKQRSYSRVRNFILEAMNKAITKQIAVTDKLINELSSHDVEIVTEASFAGAAVEMGRSIFDEEIFSKLLGAQGFSPAKLTGLENLQMGVVLHEAKLWMPVPKILPSVFMRKDPHSSRYFCFFLDHLLMWFLPAKLNLESKIGVVRLTRDADVSAEFEEEDTESIPDIVRRRISGRDRGRPVRLQYIGTFPEASLAKLQSRLKLKPNQVLRAPKSLCLHGLRSVGGLLPTELKASPYLTYPPLQPMLPKVFKSSAEELFAAIRQRDFLLHQPYDSFDAFVAWIRAACEDPKVTNIQQTVYRIDTLSPVIELLKQAAPRKKVRVVIELRARFDEVNNLRLAEELSKAGVEVAFGFGKLKIHAKIALVTRQEDGQTQLYTHLSTGNYNATTARQYTDLAILTGNPLVGEDAQHFFDSVFQGKVPTSFKVLVPAPTKLQKEIRSLIQSEIKAAQRGEPAAIVAKVNALVDNEIVEALYQASGAGVQVDLIVRGACSLIPGVKGLSENIRVVSVVDRFLEHSRIYYFKTSRIIYLSSADWMHRNFFSRLEVAFPILDPRLYKYIEEVVIPTYVNDTVKANQLTAFGKWKKRTPPASGEPIRSQFFFAELAKRGYVGTPLE